LEVIDADLGSSGRFADRRPGFEELVGRVCGRGRCHLRLGGVPPGPLLGGPVPSVGAARPTDTLVIDADGIYDLASVNDRLLLGLKSTRSEAELHFLAVCCRAPNGPLRSGASWVSRYRPGSSTTKATRPSTPTPRSKQRWLTYSPPSPPAGRPTRWLPAFKAPAVPAAPTAGCGPAKCAGAVSPTRGCWASSPTPPSPGTYVFGR
jgi:hypothetical protein